MRILTALLMIALPAHAERWILSPSESAISFVYTENDAPKLGGFPEFTGWAEYDPDAPDDSAVFIQVNTEAVQLPDFLRTAFARTEDWFATASHPRAQFELTSLTPDGGPLQAQGVITVKGRSRPVSLDVELLPFGDCLRATGSLPIDLVDFEIGRGTISRMIRVGDSVQVTFDLVGRQQGYTANCR